MPCRTRPIPSPVHNLRPARDTCEECHWPEKFHSDRIRAFREYAGDAAAFVAAAGNISSRKKTQALAAWSPPPWTSTGQADSAQRTPNIAAIIREIVGHPGWQPGNALVIIVTGTGQRVAESYDGSRTGAPLLHVEYAR